MIQVMVQKVLDGGVIELGDALRLHLSGLLRKMLGRGDLIQRLPELCRQCRGKRGNAPSHHGASHSHCPTKIATREAQEFACGESFTTRTTHEDEHGQAQGFRPQSRLLEARGRASARTQEVPIGVGGQCLCGCLQLSEDVGGTEVCDLWACAGKERLESGEALASGHQCQRAAGRVATGAAERELADKGRAGATQHGTKALSRASHELLRCWRPGW
mmetsp:Transcript_60814/g.130709  ORF Transcript_60814/g.130709 Transcript_60814/m.130709 type:complete len:217 (+) Transcript_60814:1194-1844(+)